MTAMPLRPDYSPDGDRDDRYRYGDYVPPTPQEQAQIDAEIADLEASMQSWESIDCDLCGRERLCLVIPLRRCNLHVCTGCRLEHAEELKRLKRLEGLSVGVAA